jgi:hypothetical protein
MTSPWLGSVRRDAVEVPGTSLHIDDDCKYRVRSPRLMVASSVVSGFAGPETPWLRTERASAMPMFSHEANFHLGELDVAGCVFVLAPSTRGEGFRWKARTDPSRRNSIRNHNLHTARATLVYHPPHRRERAKRMKDARICFATLE